MTTITQPMLGAELAMREIKLGPLAISAETLDDIIDTAGYGIAYWCSAATFDPNAGTYTMVDREDEEEEPYVVTVAKLHETFWRIVAGEFSMNSQVRGYFLKAVIDGYTEGTDIDAGHIDSEAADVLVQIAAFGKIVFG
jgi:hypothetical protein